MDTGNKNPLVRNKSTGTLASCRAFTEHEEQSLGWQELEGNKSVSAEVIP